MNYQSHLSPKDKELPESDLSIVEEGDLTIELSPSMKELNGKNIPSFGVKIEIDEFEKHIPTIETKNKTIELDGVWPSYCSIVEAKYGYSGIALKAQHPRKKAKKSPKSAAKCKKIFNDMIPQLNRQLKAKKYMEEEIQRNNKGCTSPRKITLFWVFSNSIAANYFKTLVKKSGIPEIDWPEIVVIPNTIIEVLKVKYDDVIKGGRK